MVTKFEISSWSIIKTILILGGLWLLWQIRDILVLLFIVFILVATLGPTVAWLVDRKWPRGLAVSLVMMAVLIVTALVLAAILPALVGQLQTFAVDQLPGLIDRLAPYYQSITEGRQLLGDLVSQLQSVSGNVLIGLVAIFGGLMSTLTVFVLTFYLLLEEHPIREAGLNLLPASYRNQIAKSYSRISSKLGAWLRGQFVLSLIVGTTTAIVMALIGVPAPLAIGVLAGLLEIIPIVGPLVTGIVMVVMAAIAPQGVLLKIVLSLGYFIILQIVEGQFLVPNIMKKAIGLSPIIVIIALLIGSQLGGIAGAILAIPIAATLEVLASDWPKLQTKPTTSA